VSLLLSSFTSLVTDESSWEMSTIGHPLSDLTNLLTPYNMCTSPMAPTLTVFQEGKTPGLPTKSQLVQWYAEVAGWDPSPDLTWGLAFHFFRATAIYQGIAARYAVRQASSEKAKLNGELRVPMGELAWEHLLKAKEAVGDKARL